MKHEKNSLLCKGIAVVVVLLFIGLAFAPSINANVSKGELVEVTTEFCGLGKKHTVQLSQQEVDELSDLFDSIDRRLDKVSTREEAVEIFNEAIVELDKYGLLGGLSVKQVQKVTTGGFQNHKLMKSLEKSYMGIQSERDSDYIYNYICLLIGHVKKECRFIRPIFTFVSEFWKWIFFSPFVRVRFGQFSNVPFLRTDIAIGSAWENIDCYWSWEPAEGWVDTVGPLAKMGISGRFYGALASIRTIPLVVPWVKERFFVGVKGFTGLKVFWDENISYIGFARKVGLTKNEPF